MPTPITTTIIRTTRLLLAVALCVLLPVGAATGAKNPNPWRQVSDDDGLTIWNRDVPGTGIRELKASSTIDAPVEVVWAVVEDLEHYPEFMPYMEKVDVLSRRADKIIAYYQIDPPLVDPRDYTLELVSETNPAAKHYIRSWSQMNELGPPPADGFVRLDVVDGSWTLSQVGTNKTKVDYWLFTNPGGSVPTWIANRANSVSIPDLYEALQKRSNNPKWKQ